VRAISILVAGCVLAAFSISCTYKGHDRVCTNKSLPQAGVLHTIACTDNPGRSYALYVPPLQTPQGSGKNGKQFYPVIIAFDPHGDGKLPLSLYKELADKFGFIMMGSMDAKNGLPQEEVREIVAALIKEVFTVYPVDTNRIYFLGFSGGARVATMAAMYQVPVKGVIGCGAGFGGGDQPIRYKFDYFGIAGTADFNMSELLELDEPLSHAGVRHVITAFPGKHEWPPVEEMDEAFSWITLNAMRDGMIKKDDAFISNLMNTFNSRIEMLTAKNQLIAAADACREAVVFITGLGSAEKWKSELISLEMKPAYQSQVAYRNNVLKKEGEEKQQLMQALQSKDLSWWKEWIRSHAAHVTRHENINPEDTLKDRRLLAFLSLYCYMNANAALAKQNEDAAIKIIAIYEMADAPNAEPNYMRAILFARRTEYDHAIDQLKIAASKGFSDKQRLSVQPEFLAMQSSPAWIDLLKSIK